MSLNRIQKTFIRLATNQQSYWSQLGRRKTKRARRMKQVKFNKWQPHTVTVDIINAVTGEKTTAKAFEESKAKLKKWLKLRNMRAEFFDMWIKKGSTFYKLDEKDFDDFPVIIQIGTYKTPYLIRHIRDRITRKGKMTITVLLETVDNVNYLELINEKKELLEKGKKK